MKNILVLLFVGLFPITVLGIYRNHNINRWETFLTSNGCVFLDTVTEKGHPATPLFSKIYSCGGSIIASPRLF